MRVYLLVLALSSPVFAWEGLVVGVVDGDTIDVIDQGKVRHRLRLAQIDAPEKKQPFGQKSKELLSLLTYQKSCEIDVIDTDRYGREVAQVACDGVDVNIEQVRAGMAWAYVKYVRDAQYLEAEKAARSIRTGLWADQNPIAPWEWRASRRLSK